MSIRIDNSIAREVKDTGVSFNTALELKYGEEINAMREKDPRLKNKSATKLAMIDSGIRGNMPVNKMFTAADEDDNEFLFPAYMADIIETTLEQSDIMGYLVSNTVNTPSNLIKAPMLDLLSDDNKKAITRKRVAEGAEFARNVIKLTEGNVELFKKGVSLEQTYEVVRRMQLDLFGIALRAVTDDLVRQNVSDAAVTLASGTVATLGTTATANTVTNDEFYDACLAYFFKYGYAPTTAICDMDMFVSLSKVKYLTTEVFGVNQKLSLNIPQVGNFDIDLIYSADTPKSGAKNQILLYNKEKSLSRYIETGSALTEYDKDITRQKEIVVVSEVSGFAKFINSVGAIVSA